MSWSTATGCACRPKDDIAAGTRWNGNGVVVLVDLRSGTTHERSRRHRHRKGLNRLRYPQSGNEQLLTIELRCSGIPGPSGDGFCKLQPTLSLPAPALELDFRMVLELSDATATVATGDHFKKYTTFTEGVWSGSLGRGTLIASRLTLESGARC